MWFLRKIASKVKLSLYLKDILFFWGEMTSIRETLRWRRGIPSGLYRRSLRRVVYVMELLKPYWKISCKLFIAHSFYADQKHRAPPHR